jgi:hypothetical protein
MSQFIWGVDGLGRAHIAKEVDSIIIFCMLDGYCGQIGVWDLEDQELWKKV